MFRLRAKSLDICYPPAFLFKFLVMECPRLAIKDLIGGADETLYVRLKNRNPLNAEPLAAQAAHR